MDSKLMEMKKTFDSQISELHDEINGLIDWIQYL